jgi:hypothetical protein
MPRSRAHDDAERPDDEGEGEAGRLETADEMIDRPPEPQEAEPNEPERPPVELRYIISPGRAELQWRWMDGDWHDVPTVMRHEL